VEILNALKLSFSGIELVAELRIAILIQTSRYYQMKKIKTFFWLCSGADITVLEQCPVESSKYAGIGATIFFTGVFAALSGAYALYTVFDNPYTAVAFGLLWGLMIFNLDRYIVSSMRKEGKVGREFLMASPRILLAVLISIVIAKPLELKIFDKEIQPELIVMEQEVYAKQEEKLKLRFAPMQDSLEAAIRILKEEIASKALKRDEMVKLAQEEADGTGGSKRKNLGPIYKVKKANADAAEKELLQISFINNQQIRKCNETITENDSLMIAEKNAFVRGHMDGPAARIEALSRLTNTSAAIHWAHWFIFLLFIAIETAPVFVKLISSKGPYDNLIKAIEHQFFANETESLAKVNAQAKENVSVLPQHERDFVSKRLDSVLE
jgi:hypothetical protein